MTVPIVPTQNTNTSLAAWPAGRPRRATGTPVADARVAALPGKAALRGAVCNVEINVNSLANREFGAALSKEGRELDRKGASEATGAARSGGSRAGTRAMSGAATGTQAAAPSWLLVQLSAGGGVTQVRPPHTDEAGSSADDIVEHVEQAVGFILPVGPHQDLAVLCRGKIRPLVSRPDDGERRCVPANEAPKG
ncbi:MAG: cyclodeaminase/cyclohydrolase family protein [Gemmatimonadetes bacterium]|nr:cyclodeaminase/cyclohydrolase family protein [Gemmatimonadota bacterium]